jgi:hypothetical protein
MRHRQDVSIALSALGFFAFPIAFHVILASASAHKLQIVIFTFVLWAISTIIGIRQAFAISAAGPASNLGAVFQFSLLVAGAIVAASAQLV